MELEAYELVMLRRPANATEYEDATLEEIQRQHLAFKAKLREEGVLATNGPVLDQPDESLRGLSFFRTGSLEKARELAMQDPAVKAGRLAVEVMTWWCPPGSLTQPGAPITITDE
jgi:uncharacterized protein YciI